VLVGTTDLEHDMGDPIVCTDEEIDYFIELIGEVLPAIEVAREQIVYRFAGVRPLPGHGDIAPGFVSREYRIDAEPLAGGDATVLSLVGGKWTTFRASAENLADRALELLAQPRRRSTRGVPIGGGRGYPTTERARQQWIAGHAAGLAPARVATLLDRYGTIAENVIAAIVVDETDAPLEHLPAYSTAELRHLARTEDVVHLDDLLMRRTSVAFTGYTSPEAAAEMAAAVGPVLGWDAARIADETARGIARVHAADPSWASESATAPESATAR
jgi:glycerol-3-phosphate dehydrogenase